MYWYLAHIFFGQSILYQCVLSSWGGWACVSSFNSSGPEGTQVAISAKRAENQKLQGGRNIRCCIISSCIQISRAWYPVRCMPGIAGSRHRERKRILLVQAAVTLYCCGMDLWLLQQSSSTITLWGRLFATRRLQTKNKTHVAERAEITRHPERSLLRRSQYYGGAYGVLNQQVARNSVIHGWNNSK